MKARAILVLIAVVIFLCCSRITKAQTAFGVELGAGSYTQLGTMTCDCGASFNGGSGNGFTGAAFFEMPVAGDFFFGAKLGLNFKKSSSTILMSDTAIVNSGSASSPQMDTLAMPMNRMGVLSLSLLNIEPFVQYQVVGTKFFLQISPTLSFVLRSNFTQTRQLLINSIALKDGTVIQNITMTNGTDNEVIQDDNVPNINTLLFSTQVAAGYNFDIAGFTVAPVLSYELPISNVQSNENWKLSSWYGSLLFKFVP